MYKALKDNKIIAISDTDNEFICLVKDEVVEDTKHTVADYTMFGSEYLLNEDVPAPTQEEQRAARETAFEEEADPLRYAYEEDVARYGADSEQALASKEIWLAKKDEIRERYPYPIGPITE